MTVETGVITGELTAVTGLRPDGRARVRVQYTDAGEWYQVQGSPIAVLSGDLASLHQAVLAAVRAGGGATVKSKPPPLRVGCGWPRVGRPHGQPLPGAGGRTVSAEHQLRGAVRWPVRQRGRSRWRGRGSGDHRACLVVADTGDSPSATGCRWGRSHARPAVGWRGRRWFSRMLCWGRCYFRARKRAVSELSSPCLSAAGSSQPRPTRRPSQVTDRRDSISRRRYMTIPSCSVEV